MKKSLKPHGRPFLTKIEDSVFLKNKVQISLLRLEVIHTQISGNKWYKLKYNIEEAFSKNSNTILTFGGAYSNHILATAFAAREVGLKSVGIIRGERIDPLNPTLRDAASEGMQLHFVSRSDYRNKTKQEFIQQLKEKFGDFYLLPEGGTNMFAIKGVAEILKELPENFDFVITAAGTGGTMAGIVSGLEGSKQVLGISVLKGDVLKTEVENLVHEYSENYYNNWGIINSYHFGGYAKFTDELISFINNFKKQYGFGLDPIYTGKMMFAIFDLASKGFFEPDTTIVALHTGGLQGIRGFNERFGELIT